MTRKQKEDDTGKYIFLFIQEGIGHRAGAAFSDQRALAYGRKRFRTQHTKKRPFGRLQVTQKNASAPFVGST